MSRAPRALLRSLAAPLAAGCAALVLASGPAAAAIHGPRALGWTPTLWTTALALALASLIGALVYLGTRMLARRRARLHAAAPAGGRASPAPRATVGAALGALFLLAGILLVVTVVVYQASMQGTVASMRRMLSNLADMQARSLAHDRDRLEAGALAFGASRLLRDEISELRATASDPARNRLRILLTESARAFGFKSAELWTAGGGFVLGTDAEPQRMDLPALIARVASSGQLAAVPSPQGVGIGFIVNLPVPSRPGVEACCVLYLASAAQPEVHPLLAAVLDNTRTAEALLLRQDAQGRTVVVSGIGAPAAVPGALHRADPFAFAAGPDRPDANGLGQDPSGQDVIAVRRQIPGTASALLLKIDMDEVVAGARTSAFLSAALALLLLLLALAVGRGLWQKNRLRDASRELKATLAVNAAEARFRAAFEQAASGMMHLDLDGTIVRANATASHLLGRPAAELAGQPLAGLRGAGEATPLAFDPLVKGEVPLLQAEDLYSRPDGTPIWLACTFSLVRTPEGVPEHILVVAQDVSARRAAEAALRESEERFDLAVQGSDQGVWDFDVRSGHLYLSPRARDMLGIGPQEKVSAEHVLKTLVHPGDRRMLAHAWAGVVRGREQSFSCEMRMRRPDGSFHDFTCQGLAARDGYGRTARIAGMVADVTRRKQIERNLRLSSAVFASSYEGLVVTDLDSVISAVNPSFTRITGYTADEIIGQTMRVLHSGRHDRDFYREMWRTLTETGSWQGDIWNRRKNGEIFLQQLTISTVYDQNGAPQNYVGAFQDITQIKHSEFQLDRIAHYDPLTDLPNRTLIASLLDLAVHRPGKTCAVIFLDLDRFKTVNDSLGHRAGDQVLQVSAERIRAALDASGTVGRYGADEFVVILEEVEGADDAAATATRLIHELSLPFPLADGREAYLGASAGISLYPDDADSAARLLQHADSALAEAKSQGRGSYAFYTHALTRSARVRMEMEADLRRGLARDEFRLNFQPVASLATGRIHGAEALVRWHSPVHGLVTPNRFIPLAEETGLIVQLGAWVLETACRQMVEWLDQGVPLDFIAVNLSPRQFRREALVEQVADMLRRTGLPPERLEVEITESVLFDVRTPAERKLRDLKDLGVRIALDDFGTGYSSLAYLKRFPISKLKIDRSFVRDLPRQADGEIATAIISIARALGLEVVAEGIETPEQCDFLRQRGCDYGQGHLFSRPVTGERLMRLVQMGPFSTRPTASNVTALR